MLIGVQTYTIRKAARRDLTGALARLRALGVQSVELARVAFSQENAAIVRSSGLAVSSVQAKYKELNRDFDAMLAFCEALDCRVAVVSVLPLSCILGGERPLRAFALRLEGLAARYREKGITLAFHHHDFEFKKLGASAAGPSGGQSKLEFLVGHSSPAVKFVLDTYWAKRAGDDPCRLIAWLGERLAGLHLRDHAIVKKGSRFIHMDTELGRGDIDFAAVVKAASPFASYAAIEQKSEAPFDSLAHSLERLKRLGLLGERLDAGKDAGQDAGQNVGKVVSWR